MDRTKVIRNLLSSLLLAASAIGVPAYAQVSVNINVAPPAPQYEVVPTLQPGYVWAPGYWGWNGDRHVWIGGRSIAQREGYLWAPDRWEQRDGSYYRTAGHWEHDKGFKPVKMRKEMKHEDRHNGDRGEHGEGKHGHGNNGKHGRGGENEG